MKKEKKPAPLHISSKVTEQLFNSLFDDDSDNGKTYGRTTQKHNMSRINFGSKTECPKETILKTNIISFTASASTTRDNGDNPDSNDELIDNSSY